MITGPTFSGSYLRPKWPARVMSGLPPIATELRTSPEVRFVQKTTLKTQALSGGVCQLIALYFCNTRVKSTEKNHMA